MSWVDYLQFIYNFMKMKCPVTFSDVLFLFCKKIQFLKLHPLSFFTLVFAKSIKERGKRVFFPREKSLSLSVSVCLCLSLSVCLCLSLSLSLSLSFSFSIFLSLSLGSWIFWQLPSSFRVSSFILFFSCLLWMLITCVTLSLHYENIDSVYIWRIMHEKLKDKNMNWRSPMNE